MAKALRAIDGFFKGPKEITLSNGEVVPIKSGSGIMIELLNPVKTVKGTAALGTKAPKVLKRVKDSRSASEIIRMEEAARIQKIRDARQMTPAKALELEREFNREYSRLIEAEQKATTLAEKQKIADLMNELENWYPY